MKIHKNTQKQKKQKKGATPPVWMPEWSKGADLRSAGYASWVRTPLQTFFICVVIFQGQFKRVKKIETLL